MSGDFKNTEPVQIKDAVLNDKWVSVGVELPVAGDYNCRVINDGRTFEAKRRLIISNGFTRWFGGCRPFADNDVITHWERQ